MKKTNMKMQRLLATVLSAFMIVTAIPTNVAYAAETGYSNVEAMEADQDAATTMVEDEILEDVLEEEDIQDVVTDSDEAEDAVTEPEVSDEIESEEADAAQETAEADEDPIVEEEAEFEAAHDALVEFTTSSATEGGIKTTTSKWDFATAKNTGKSTATGDSISGIIVGGGSGRVILDANTDLNVKNNSTAETTGVIYLPIAADTNVVTIKILPQDKDSSRYVTVGSFDSAVKLIDNADDADHQTVTFKADLADYVVENAGEVNGRYIPLFSHGNFKVKNIELVETDAVTIVDVTGKLTGEGVERVTGLKFRNETTEEIVTAEVKDGAYSISLPNGFKYIVSAAGTLAYGIDATEDANVLDLTTGNDKNKEKDFALVAQDIVELAGSFKIEKIDNANAVKAEELKVSLVPAKAALDTVELELTKGANDYEYTYTVVVLKGEEYSVKLTGANDYECTAKVQEDATATLNLEAKAKALHKVKLAAVTHNLKAVSTVTALTVKNLDDSYTYSFSGLKGSTLTLELRDGLYEVTTVTSKGSYEPYEHFEVKGEDVSENMYLKDTAEKSKVAYKSEITVGKKNSNYTTIYDALDAVKRMSRSDDQRVTIVLKDEYYQEQVVVDVPNVTFKSGRTEGSTISWYYGLGGDSYYSAYLNTEIDKNHLFYDEAHAVDQYESTTIGQTPGNWGSTVNLKSTATGFKAENITFENSFNFYISEVEKNDIASSGSILDRKAEGADPTAYKSKERACTMYNRGADNIEFYNCNFISSQDTIYTGDKDEYSYYYNCKLEGTTDFICGDGNAVFDNCELVLNGFSDQEAANLVIVASKGSATKGYLFNYCRITTDKRDGIQPVASAYLGRPWGTSDEKVAFMNTIVESEGLILDKGWTTMNTVPSLNKGLHEYKTRLQNGKLVDLSGRVATNIGSDKQGTAANYVLDDPEGYSVADYMSASWTPSYLGADYSAVHEQKLRANALMADEELYAKATDKQKTALKKAYDAVKYGLLAKDQSKVDAFAAGLMKALDDITGKQAAAPVSSLKSGTYTLSRVITLSTQTEGAKIYYTTDGSEPADTSTLYEKPIVISKSSTIKAVAIAEGYVNSEIATFEYVIEDPNAGQGGNFVLDAQELTPFAQGAKADGASEKAGTDDFFNIIYSAKSKVDSSSKTFEDGFTSSQRINLGGVASTSKNAVQFTTGGAATVKVWWAQGGDDSRQITILDSEGNAVTTTEGTWTKNSPYISELTLPEAGTYYLGSAINNNYLFKVEVNVESSGPVEYDLQSSELTAFAAGAKADGASEKAGTDEYFEVLYSAKSKVDASNKTWEDEYTSAQRINFGGVASTSMNAVKFTTNGAATVKVWWAQGGDDSRQMVILDGEGTEVAATTGTWKKNDPYISEFELANAGTYFLGSKGGNNYLFRVTVAESSGKKPDRGSWSDVPAPVITDITASGTKITVSVDAFVNYNGGDFVAVDMKDEKDDVVATAKSAQSGDKLEKTVEFELTASGTYTFVPYLGRDGEENVYGKETAAKFFALPLVKPNITAVTNKGTDANGKGKLEVTWTKVNEAKTYDVEIVTGSGEEEKVVASATGITKKAAVLEGLNVGDTVTVKVYAVRDDERSDAATATATVTGNNDRTWSFASYGSNGSTGDKAVANADGTVTIDTPSSTKIVPGSTDGIGYYYTNIDPSENFTLTAKIKVENWPYDNGQEGFGLMVADAVGDHGHNAAFWNNSYQAAVTQIQYNWDPTIKDAEGNYVGGIVKNTADNEKYFQEKMRLGLGWIARDGVTLDQKNKAESGQTDTPAGFTTESGTFETSVASTVQAQLPGITKDSTADEVRAAYKNFTITTLEKDNAASYGQLNIVDASKAAKTAKETVRKIGDVDFTDISEVRYQIQRNNTGYVLRYLSTEAIGNEADLEVVYDKDEAGNRISYVGTYNGSSVVAVDGKVYTVLSQKVIYDENRNNLTQIDKKNIYVGMFSARKTKVTVKEYSLETVDPDSDYPAEERALEAVALTTEVMSASTSNTEKYDLIFNANADGKLTVTLGNKVIAQEMAVKAGKWATVGSSLKAGDNEFKLVFTPTPGYEPGEYQYLVIDNNDPDAKSVTVAYKVKYNTISGDVIYVAPGANGDGSKASPASIYDAVSFAAPGQTIYLAGGTYNLGRANGGSNKNIRINRGTDGTATAMITMETDPEDLAKGNRAVLSFADSTGSGSAFVLSGNYWHLKNFDVTASKNGEKGILVSGKHNIVELVNTYKNGNTGLEIARDGNVGRDLWPSDNLILNCTSYLNYDAGFEDADGFAAKITAGEGNRFVGCVSAYNADDGWDLFAKVQSGSIGKVTLEGCIAYKNGYLLGYRDGADYEVFENPALSVNHKDAEKAVEFEAGNGNGFKLGGDGMSGYHELKNSYAFFNKANGIDSNSCPDIQVFNSTSYANGTNLTLNNYAKSVNSDYTVEGLISIGTSKTAKDSISMLGAQVASKIYNGSNFFWNGSASVNAANESLKATTNIFTSVDMKDLGVDTAKSVFVNRNEDGSIAFNGFLQVRSSEGVEDPALKAVLELIEKYGIGASEKNSAGQQTIEFVVFAKDVKTLADVEAKTLNGAALPEGYSWLDKNIETAPYAGTSAAFDILNETGSTATAVVNFLEVEGVQVVLDVENDGLFGESTATVTAAPVLSPAAKLDPKDEHFSYSFADKNKMGLKEETEGNVLTLSRQASSKDGVASYVATMQYTAGGKKYTVKSQAFDLSTRAAAFEFVYTLSGAEKDAEGTIVAAKAGDMFKLEGLKVVGAGTNENVVVSVSDKKVVKYANGTFTAVSAGTTYITLTAAADKTVKTTLKVKVKGKEFALNVSELTVDKAKTEGASFVVVSLGDTALADVTVAKVLKGTREMAALKDSFEISKVTDSVYTIAVKADTDAEGKETANAPKIAKGSYTVVLTSGAAEFEPVTVKVTETKPSVTLKQTKKVNLFYKAGSNENTGALTADAKNASAKLIASAGDFVLSSDGSSYKIIMTNAAQKKLESGKKLENKLTVTASFDGYKKAYNKTLNFTVKTETKAPKYVIEMDNSVLYTQLGIKDTEFRVVNKASGEYVTDAQVSLATSRKTYVKANAKFTFDEVLGVYKLATTKSGTAKISVIDPEFSKDPKTGYASDREVVVDAKLTVNNSKPAVRIAKVRLNGDEALAEISKATAAVTVKNAKDYTVRDLVLVGKNKKAKALLPFLNYEFTQDAEGQPVIEVTFKDSDDTTIAKAIESGIIKKGSYSFTANYAINKIAGMKTAFTVQVTTGAKATGKVKGSINLVDRTNTYATVSATVKNIDATVTGVEFLGNSSLFEIKWDSAAGVALVYAKDGASYRAGSRYKVTPVFTVTTALGQGMLEAKPVYISVKQTALKLDKIAPVEVKISEKDAEGRAATKVTAPKGAVIEAIQQLDQTDKFEVSYDAGSGNLYVAVANAGNVKAGSSYNVKLEVIPEGNGASAKKQTITLKVKVIR